MDTRPVGHDLEEVWITANGVRFYARAAGAGRLILLLHGFPQCWYSWRHQIPALATRYRAVAPDLRGYNRSEKPSSGYDLGTLADDIAGLIDRLGYERAVVVGHDWGGEIGWAVAMKHPERVAALAVLNAPHPAAYRREALRNPRQMLRSWYVLFFQIPRLPEQLLTAFHGRLTMAMLRRTAHPGTFSADDLAVYRDAITQPGAARAALAYYRAPFRSPRSASRWLRRIDCPTLVLWGTADLALDEALLDGHNAWAPNLTIRRFPGVSHWLPEERPAEVSEALLTWLDHLN